VWRRSRATETGGASALKHRAIAYPAVRVFGFCPYGCLPEAAFINGTGDYTQRRAIVEAGLFMKSKFILASKARRHPPCVCRPHHPGAQPPSTARVRSRAAARLAACLRSLYPSCSASSCFAGGASAPSDSPKVSSASFAVVLFAWMIRLPLAPRKTCSLGVAQRVSNAPMIPAIPSGSLFGLSRRMGATMVPKQAVFGLLMLFIFYVQETPFLDSSSPVWAHVEPVKRWPCASIRRSLNRSDEAG